MAAKKKGRKKSVRYDVPSPPPEPGMVREMLVLEPPRIRKNMDIDVELLAAARRALGARTDTEAVNRALAEVARAEVIIGAMDELRLAGGLDDVLGQLDD
jgi:Arc/MetJ family transcription regulator